MKMKDAYSMYLLKTVVFSDFVNFFVLFFVPAVSEFRQFDIFKYQ